VPCAVARGVDVECRGIALSRDGHGLTVWGWDEGDHDREGALLRTKENWWIRSAIPAEVDVLRYRKVLHGPGVTAIECRPDHGRAGNRIGGHPASRGRAEDQPVLVARRTQTLRLGVVIDVRDPSPMAAAIQSSIHTRA